MLSLSIENSRGESIHSLMEIEEEISQALNNLFEWKTVIIVAHRLQTVKSADRILLFEDWKVVEDGTHQSLTRKNWKYKKMLDLQSGF